MIQASVDTIGVVIGIILLLLISIKICSVVMENPDHKKMIATFIDDDGQNFYAISTGVTTSYLLPCNGGYLLIDTGFPKDLNKFLIALKQIKVDIKEIKYLLLTHSHDDHAGFAYEITTNSGTIIVTSQKSIHPLRDGIMKWSGHTVNKLIHTVTSLYNLLKRRDCKFHPLMLRDRDIIIVGDDEQFLKTIGVKGMIIYTPGHSMDSISVIMDDGRVFCGDAAMNFLNSLGADYRPIFISDDTQVFLSWRKIIDRGGKKIYPAHGKPFDSAILIRGLARYPN